MNHLKNKHNLLNCTVDDCNFATLSKLDMSAHSDRNHSGYKCTNGNCTYFIMDKLDSFEHKLARHPDKEVSASDREYMETLKQVNNIQNQFQNFLTLNILYFLSEARGPRQDLPMQH